jgi:hypothetical protein
MKRKISIISIVLFFLTSMASAQMQANENLLVFQTDGSYKVFGQVSGKKLYKTNYADEAIQFAIDRLPKGGMVSLQSGKFLVKNQINLKSFITLKGIGASSIIQMQPGHNTGIAIKGDSLVKVNINNLSVINSKNDSTIVAAINLSSCGDCQVSDIFCVGMRHAGVWFNSHTYLSEIRSCKFADIKGAGVLLEKLGSGIGGEYLPNLVTNCIAYRCGIGFLMNRAIVVNLNGCIVHQCKNAFYLQNGSNSVCITGSRSFQIEEEAVIVDSSHEINITGNIFCWSVKEAIKFNNVRWGTITGNNLIDVGSVNFYTRDINTENKQHLVFPPPNDLEIPHYSALKLNDVKGVTITSNAMFNWHVCPKMLYGIHEAANCANNIITSNNINWVVNEGVNSLGKNTIVANNLTVADENHLKPHKGVYQVFDVKTLDDIIEKMLEYVKDLI